MAGCLAVAEKPDDNKKKKSKTATLASGGGNYRPRIRYAAPSAEDVLSGRYVAVGSDPSMPLCAVGGTGPCAIELIGEPAPDAPRTVSVSPYDAAVIAMAYLPLQPGKPTIGPPPSINKWKMAAVGYPLWVWAEGDLDPAPVSRTVSGLSVSLDADLAKIVYDLGDGSTISCGPGTPWRKGSVPAGTPSPDCGHTYTKPSLPKGSYTITATTHWSVAWTAGGQSGTIPFTQTSTTTLPVGEVQTLVR